MAKRDEERQRNQQNRTPADVETMTGIVYEIFKMYEISRLYSNQAAQPFVL